MSLRNLASFSSSCPSTNIHRRKFKLLNLHPPSFSTVSLAHAAVTCPAEAVVAAEKAENILAEEMKDNDDGDKDKEKDADEKGAGDGDGAKEPEEGAGDGDAAADGDQGAAKKEEEEEEGDGNEEAGSNGSGTGEAGA